MSGNTFGKLFQLTSFGESHGKAVGGIIEGVPSGFDIDIPAIQADLDKRRPGKGKFSSSRNEEDRLEILSGVFEGKTLGTPLAFYVRNKDAKSSDYDHLVDIYRPSHADYTWEKKYGLRDHRGGGRASARETLSRVVAGSIAKQILARKYGIQICSYTSQIGNVKVDTSKSYGFHEIDSNELRCPDEKAYHQMLDLLHQIKEEKDSIGGIVHTRVKSMLVGIGEPVFDKLQAVLAHAMLSINAAKGFQYGVGFDAVHMKGSEQNDSFIMKGDTVTSEKNYSGGILGGISSGQDVYFDVAFKAVSTIGQDQETVNREGEKVVYSAGGRHDVCIVPRAVPIVESMTAMVVFDMLLQNKAH